MLVPELHDCVVKVGGLPVAVLALDHHLQPGVPHKLLSQLLDARREQVALLYYRHLTVSFKLGVCLGRENNYIVVAIGVLLSPVNL